MSFTPIDQLRAWAAAGADAPADQYALAAERSDRMAIAWRILGDTQGRARRASEQRELDNHNDAIDLIDKIIDEVSGESRRRTAVAQRARFVAPYFGSGTDTRGGSALGEELLNAIHEVRDGRSVAYVDFPEARALSEGGSGGYGVPVQIGASVSNMKARSVVMSLPGVQTFPMQSDRVRWPRFGTATAGVVGENTTLTAAATDLDAVEVVAVKYGTYEIISTELEEDFSTDALAAVGDNLLKQLALKVDLGLLEGTGAPDTVGIRNVPGANSTSLAAAPTNFVKFRDAEYELRADNGEPAVWVMHPRSWSRLAAVKTGLASDETTLLSPNPQQGPKTLLGYPVAFSSQITLTEGAGAGSWAALLDTSQIIVCERRPARLEVSRDLKFDQDSIAIRATWRGGLAVLNPEAVSLVTDIR